MAKLSLPLPVVTLTAEWLTAGTVGVWGQALLPLWGNSVLRTRPLPQPTASSLVVVFFACCRQKKTSAVSATAVLTPRSARG
jgi:hypothetical protein